MKTHLIAACLLGAVPGVLAAQGGSTTINVSGFVMMDSGYNADQIDPNWYDVVPRPPMRSAAASTR